MVLVLLISVIQSAFGQGTLRGNVTDEKGNPISIANILLLNGTMQIGSASSSDDGTYVIRPILPGKYIVIASSVGYRKYIKNVVTDTAILVLNIQLNESSQEFTTNDTGYSTYSKKQSGSQFLYVNDPTRSSSVQGNDGQLGSTGVCKRTESTITYVDATKNIKPRKIPKKFKKEVDVQHNGTPAKFENETEYYLDAKAKAIYDYWEE